MDWFGVSVEAIESGGVITLLVIIIAAGARVIATMGTKLAESWERRIELAEKVTDALKGFGQVLERTVTASEARSESMQAVALSQEQFARAFAAAEERRNVVMDRLTEEVSELAKCQGRMDADYAKMREQLEATERRHIEKTDAILRRIETETEQIMERAKRRMS